MHTHRCWGQTKDRVKNARLVRYWSFRLPRTALSRCLKCGRLRPTPRFSDRPCTHSFPRGHCLASMGSNLCCGAVGLGWDEEVSDGGEDRHEMLQ